MQRRIQDKDRDLIASRPLAPAVSLWVILFLAACDDEVRDADLPDGDLNGSGNGVANGGTAP